MKDLYKTKSYIIFEYIKVYVLKVNMKQNNENVTKLCYLLQLSTYFLATYNKFSHPCG